MRQELLAIRSGTNQSQQPAQALAEPVAHQRTCDLRLARRTLHEAAQSIPSFLAVRAQPSDGVDVREPAAPGACRRVQADLHSLAGAIGMEDAAPVQVFATVRARKDKF